MNPVWAKKFEDAGVPIVGDDIQSQVGATITHRVMAKLFEDRGVTLDRTYQLNVGGNMDFKNMPKGERLESKLGLQDPGRHLQPDRLAGRQGRGQERSHRTVRPRRVADDRKSGPTSASRAAPSVTCR